MTSPETLAVESRSHGSTAGRRLRQILSFPALLGTLLSVNLPYVVDSA